MASFRVTPPAHPSLSPLYIVVGLVVAAALIAIASASSGPITVTIDGVARQVPAGSLVGDIGAGAFESLPGSLLALNGSVIETAGGHPPVIARGGHAARATTQLFDGDVLTSHPGTDVMERAITETITIPFGTRIEGDGPISQVATVGVSGITQVTRGERSRTVVVSFVVRDKVDQVVVHVRPPAGAKLIALTFDDGPWPGQTEGVLDVLKANQVPATFFLVGGRATANPDLVRRIAAEGHLVGSHTLGHRGLTHLTPVQLHTQIGHGADRITSILSTEPVWFRPPYGAMNGNAWREVRALDMRVANWDVDSDDWRQPGTKRIVANVLGAAKPGAIVLMHDGGGERRQTIGALPEIIQTLKAQGYVFVTVQDLAPAR